MGIYSGYSDAELAAEIVAYRTARRNVLTGADGSGVGTVTRIRDGDRQIDYTGANIGALDRELTALLREQARRLNGGIGGNAIEVEFE